LSLINKLNEYLYASCLNILTNSLEKIPTLMVVDYYGSKN